MSTKRTSLNLSAVTRFSILIIMLLAVISFGLSPWLGCPIPSQDLAQTIYQAKKVAQGAIPHRDIFCHHLLGYLIPFTIIDLITPITLTGIKFLAIAYHLAFCIGVFWILLQLMDKKSAIIGSFIAATAGLAWGWLGTSFNAQNYLFPSMILAFGYSALASLNNRPRYLYLTGIFFGTSVLSDQRFILFAPLILLPLFFQKDFRKPKVIFLYLMALLSLPTIYSLYLFANGAFAAMVDQTIIYPLTARNAGEPFQPQIYLNLLKTGFNREPIFTLTGLLGLAILIARERRRPLVVAIISLIPSAFLYPLISGREFANYLLIFVPVLVILTTCLFFYPSRDNFKYKRVFQSLIISLIVLFSARPIYQYFNTGDLIFRADDRVRPQIAEYVKNNSTTTDEVFFWGGYAMSLYLESERYTSFVDPSLITIGGTIYDSQSQSAKGILADRVEEFKRYMISSPPKIFVSYIPKNSCTKSLCLDCGVETLNLDFKTLPYLQYLKEIISSKYILVSSLESDADSGEIYILK